MIASTPIEPIRDLEELVPVYAAVLQNAGPPEDIERVLDGVSRLCGERSPSLTEPIAQRAEKFLKAPALYAVSGAFDGRWDPRHCLCALALAWLRSEPATPGKACHGVGSFLTARVAELTARVLDGRARPLAGVPSHTGSWIHPTALVERLQEHPEPDRLDLIQALLRLSADGREEALEHSRSLPGPTGRIVRFALGSDDCRRPPRFYDESLWLAAGQARDPEGGAGVHRLHWAVSTQEMLGEAYTKVQVDLETWPRFDMDASKPAALTAEPGAFNAPMLRWCSTVWPAHREGWFAAGALALARNLDWNSDMWWNRVYLETLAAHRETYGPMAYQLLAIGLACKETGEGLAACEAFLAALDRKLVDSDRLSDTFAKLAVEGVIPIHRCVARFTTLARTGRSYAAQVFAVMDRMLASAPIPANERYGLLELLCEIREQTGQQLSATAKEQLAAMVPGKKTAALRRKLLD